MAVAGGESERIAPLPGRTGERARRRGARSLPRRATATRNWPSVSRAAEHDANLAAPQPVETEGMSRAMSLVDETGPELGGDDAVAAEYVLGVLPGGRTPARGAAHRDGAGFRAARRSLGGLLRAARRRLCLSRGSGVDQGGYRWRACLRPRQVAARSPVRLPAWRSGAALPSRRSQRLRFSWHFRSSARRSDIPRSAAGRLPGSRWQRRALPRRLRRRTGDIGLSRVAGAPPQGRDFELWVIEGDQAPVSLGVIPDGEQCETARHRGIAGKDAVRRGCSPSASSRTAARHRPADRACRGRRRPEVHLTYL